MSKLRVLDLFSGIGGFSLGLERTGGFETVAFCEIEPFPRRVLAKHWPKVPCYDDVRTLTADALRRDGIAVDVICGGFPCQDISFAGAGAGIEGERSGLWSEYARLIGELRPQFVIVENVAALLSRGLDRVLGDLAALGFDAWWDCIPASAVGAPHRRDRLWLVAYPDREPVRDPRHREFASQKGEAQSGWEEREWVRVDASASSGREDVSHARGARLEGVRERFQTSGTRLNDTRRQFGGVPVAAAIAHAIGGQLAQCGSSGRVGREEPVSGNGHWPVTSEPFVRRGDHGISNRAHRLRALGNAVVPQIPELIGRAILASREATS
jgi:DNA (cytosine-5)-methyltransferase 1